MKKIVRITENDIRNAVRQIINETTEIEDVETYDIFNDNFDGNWPDILMAYLYDKNDTCVGALRDLHFKYVPETNKLISQGKI